MKYCPNCQELFEKEETVCPSCGKESLRPARTGDPVPLCTVSNTEALRITSLLEDYAIPCEARNRGENPAGFEVDPGQDKEIFVPYAALTAAKQLLEAPTEGTEEAESLMEEESAGAASKQMSPKTRAVWRAVSVVLLVLLIWAVVAGSDWLIAWVKDLFTK